MERLSENEALSAGLGAAPVTRPCRAIRRCRVARPRRHIVLLAAEHEDHNQPGAGRSHPSPGGPDIPGPRHGARPSPPDATGDTAYADVLVVDDDADVRSSMAAILRSRGFSVLEAIDGQAAKDTLDVTRIGVVVLDLHMAPHDGVWLLEQLRDPPAVILVSAFAHYSESDMRERFSSKVSQFVLKPVPPARLIALVEEALAPPPS